MSEGDPPVGLRLAIRWTLQVGVAASVVLLIVGIILLGASGESSIHAPAAKASLGALPGELAGGNAQGFLFLGVIVLVFTPLVRVLLSLGAFASVEDVPFALMTLFVLVILSVGLVLGLVP